jgi:hypothetical protein
VLLLDQSFLKSFHHTQDFAIAYDSINKGGVVVKSADDDRDNAPNTTPTTPTDNAQLYMANNIPQMDLKDANGTGRFDRIISFGATMSTK